MDPDELARRILRFLEDRLPRYTESRPVRETLDLLPIIKVSDLFTLFVFFCLYRVPGDAHLECASFFLSYLLVT